MRCIDLWVYGGGCSPSILYDYTKSILANRLIKCDEFFACHPTWQKTPVIILLFKTLNYLKFNLFSYRSLLYFFHFSLKCAPANEEVDFTDFGYQNTLPLHARPTASQVLRIDTKQKSFV